MKNIEEIKRYLENAEGWGSINKSTRQEIEKQFLEYQKHIDNLVEQIEGTKVKSEHKLLNQQKDLETQGIINKALECFPKSFINEKNEIILEPKNNVFFGLHNVHSTLDFKCNLIAWLSRPIIKVLNKYWSTKVLDSVNQLLDTNFTIKDMKLIESYLGQDLNRELTVKFIESNYNFSVFDSLVE